MTSPAGTRQDNGSQLSLSRSVDVNKGEMAHILGSGDYYTNMKARGESQALVPTDNRDSEMRQFEE